MVPCPERESSGPRDEKARREVLENTLAEKMAEDLANAIVLAAEKMHRKEKDRPFGTLYAIEDKNKDGISAATKFYFGSPPDYSKEFHNVEQALTWIYRTGGFERVPDHEDRGLVGLVVSVDPQYSITRSRKIVGVFRKRS